LLVCPRKLWMSAHGLSREQESELVTLGSLMHESSFSRERKEILVLGHIKIDHTTKGQKLVVHEVKKTKKYSHAARAQLLFYLYELERLGIVCQGELHFRSERRREPVSMDSESRQYVQSLIERVGNVIMRDEPPAVRKGAPCRKCAYRDYCRV
ncbi:MAG: CRISPR-associated protein Cas4, partial [Candidatus Aenigmatarchaeota archaeon]